MIAIFLIILIILKILIFYKLFLFCIYLDIFYLINSQYFILIYIYIKNIFTSIENKSFYYCLIQIFLLFILIYFHEFFLLILFKIFKKKFFQIISADARKDEIKSIREDARFVNDCTTWNLNNELNSAIALTRRNTQQGITSLTEVSNRHHLYIRVFAYRSMITYLRELRLEIMLENINNEDREIIRYIIDRLYNHPNFYVIRRNLNQLDNRINPIPLIYRIPYSNDIMLRIQNRSILLNIPRNINLVNLNRILPNILRTLISFDRINYSQFYPNLSYNNRTHLSSILNRFAFNSMTRSALQEIYEYSEESSSEQVSDSNFNENILEEPIQYDTINIFLINHLRRYIYFYIIFIFLFFLGVISISSYFLYRFLNANRSEIVRDLSIVTYLTFIIIFSLAVFIFLYFRMLHYIE